MIKELFDYLYSTYELLFSNISFFSELYIRFHKPSVKKEINLFHLSHSDHILHIGSGAIPYTVVIIAKEIGARVVGIDNNQRFVKIADSHIKNNNLSNIAKIEKGDGKNYNVSDFNVIIISYGISEQDIVLRHVFYSMKKGAKIILRRPTVGNNKNIDPIIKKFSINTIRSLMSQESVLIVNKS